MSLWREWFSRRGQPAPRVRICVECGMPVAEHKNWCSILRTRQELERRTPDAPPAR